MSCKDCEKSLEDLEFQMFSHIITQIGDKWHVRCDSGKIVPFDDRTKAMTFVFDGGHQDG